MIANAPKISMRLPCDQRHKRLVASLSELIKEELDRSSSYSSKNYSKVKVLFSEIEDQQEVVSVAKLEEYNVEN